MCICFVCVYICLCVCICSIVLSEQKFTEKPGQKQGMMVLTMGRVRDWVFVLFWECFNVWNIFPSGMVCLYRLRGKGAFSKVGFVLPNKKIKQTKKKTRLIYSSLHLLHGSSAVTGWWQIRAMFYLYHTHFW